MTNRVNSKWHRECLRYGEEFIKIEPGSKHDIAYFRLGSVLLPRGTRISDCGFRNVKARIKSAALGRNKHATSTA